MSTIYQVQPEDLKGDIEGFPIEVVQKMVERQYEQIGICDVVNFQVDRDASSNLGGFTWSETSEGHNFWREVIIERDWELFFSRCPSEAGCKTSPLPYQKKVGLTRLQKWYLNHKELFPEDIDWMSLYTFMSCMTPRELAKAYEELNLYPYFEYTGNTDKEARFLGLLRSAREEIELARGNLCGTRKRQVRISMYEYSVEELLRAIIGWIKKNPMVVYRAQLVAFRGCDITITVARVHDAAGHEWEYQKDLGVKKSNAGPIYLINGEVYKIC